MPAVLLSPDQWERSADHLAAVRRVGFDVISKCKKNGRQLRASGHHHAVGTIKSELVIPRTHDRLSWGSFRQYCGNANYQLAGGHCSIHIHLNQFQSLIHVPVKVAEHAPTKA
jgi:hypothetical protein